MLKQPKHSKLKNTGIIFELLIRQVTYDILEGVQNSPAIKILSKYFNKKTELGKDLLIYKTIVSTNTLSESRSENLLQILQRSKEFINKTVLERQKYQVIKEIKENYDVKKFFSYKIPDYKILASIYMLFEHDPKRSSVGDELKLFESRNVILNKLQESPTTTNQVKDEVEVELEQLDHESRALTYKIMLEKFNNKYKKLLPKQKKLLGLLITEAPGSNKLNEQLVKDITSLYKTLTKSIIYIDDDVTKIKLTESIKIIQNMMTKKSYDSDDVLRVMLFHELLTEITEL